MDTPIGTGPLRQEDYQAMGAECRVLTDKVKKLEAAAMTSLRRHFGWAFLVAGIALVAGIVTGAAGQKHDDLAVAQLEAAARAKHEPTFYERNEFPCYETGQSEKAPEPWERAYVFRCDAEEIQKDVEPCKNGWCYKADVKIKGPQGRCYAVKNGDRDLWFATEADASDFAERWHLRMCQ